MGRRAAAVDHGRWSADDASLRDTADDSEDLSAFVAQPVSDDPIPDARTPQTVPAPKPEPAAVEHVASAPSEPDVFVPPVPVELTIPARPIEPVVSATPAQPQPATPEFSEPPRSRREARERLRAAQAAGPEAPVAPPEPAAPAPTPPSAETATAGTAALAYPSRRALREARAAQPVAETLYTPADDAELPNTPRQASAAQGIAFGGGDFRRHHNAGAHEPGGHVHRRLQASRKPALIAGSAVLALIPGLMFAAPANAAESISPQQLQATIASNSKLIAQKLQVSPAVADGSLQKENYVAGAIAGIVAAESGPNGPEVAVALAQALQYGGEREKIVETALTYLGDPYALGGASHDGIDCSGLTMVAYATVGVSLVHYVPSQDAVAAPISEAAAQPGDLVFFNDDEHVALYLGGGMIIEAPDYGIPVRIVSLSTWSGIGYHFGRVLAS